ncbi:MAG: hypothetical protein A3A28_01645 [Candidatus Sungbacteria bacterium RIFCSPLOWO2_01_FULL_47_32]|uniref:Uncharacterized protein n=1 Tax=Candidatus Sungbacteria bacterium RIFCSPHIGHO2_01_FULL_47_32 TaxID=1802264 RepID=A0A1G2K6I1_9BACT|nr:MAG: hypothetical protein A2633_03960 [Candidatus Sungbacteria bacterium RIFCSPHIGHO2_01_FULL_47_32]OGZ98525.1 MAG: hypothetical protein A3D57_00155 [Candidatus Sungbacteria bacterium RIFCSPHIGHO2_02_FULL_46_12]OHA05272.1 MAG: hypothetical protein A3A28_01645 [Candidatus Sungbacteria bacterium RIFCSPLOWO2_01_FULL_47_32]
MYIDINIPHTGISQLINYPIPYRILKKLALYLAKVLEIFFKILVQGRVIFFIFCLSNSISDIAETITHTAEN